MKLHIKTLAAAFVAGLALVSCNNDFDENDLPTISYPEKVQLGMWTRQYTPTDDPYYTVNVTVNADGDTICDVTTYDPATKMANVYSGGKVSYNAKIGMLTANYAEDAEGTPARATITYAADKQSMMVNLYNVGEDDEGQEGLTNIDHFTAVASDTISVLGRWELTDGTTIQLNHDGTAAVVDGQDVLSEGTFTYDGQQGTATIGGQTYALSFNKTNGQMNVNSAYASHVMTPLPDDWTEWCVGTYKSGIFGMTVPNVYIYYSASRRRYRMDPYGTYFGAQSQYATTPYVFSFDENDGSIKFKQRKDLSIGIDLQMSDGTNYGQGLLNVASNSEIDNYNAQYGATYGECEYLGYKDDVFTFAWTIHTPSVNMGGAYNDTYLISDRIETE